MIRRVFRTIVSLLVLAGGLLGSHAAMAVTAAEKCQAKKIKIAGKYGFCRLKVEANAIKRGVAVDNSDFDKCDVVFGTKWASAETAATSAGDKCPTTSAVNQDLAKMTSSIADHVDCVAAALANGGACDYDSCTQALDGCYDLVAVHESTISSLRTQLTACNGALTQCVDQRDRALRCGDGVLDQEEECDQGVLAGKTCVSEGRRGGTLACGRDCKLDESGCFDERFVDNLDGTVTDNLTALMWEKKGALNGSPQPGSPHDADNEYIWASTCTSNGAVSCQPSPAATMLCVASTEGHRTGCDKCPPGAGPCRAAETVWTFAAELNSTRFAGYDDWRIPTRAELEGILDFADTAAPLVDAKAFQDGGCATCTDVGLPECSCTQSGDYWTSSAWPLQPASAWVVDFSTGRRTPSGRDQAYFARAVRSIQ